MIKENFLRKFKGYKFYAEPRLDDASVTRVFTICDLNDEPVHSFPFTYEDPNSLNKAIETAKNWVGDLAKSEPGQKKEDASPVRTCRVCGCTENNCQQCIDKTGSPCWWVEEDLCSACKEEPEIKVTDNRASSGAVDSLTINSDMRFFAQLATIGDIDMTMRIYKKGDSFTLGIMPGNKSRNLKPLNITGTAEELDEGFMNNIIPAAREIKGLVSNLEDIKKNPKSSGKDMGDDEESSDESKKSSPRKKASPKKKSAKPVVKKAAPKKKKPAAKPKTKNDKVTKKVPAKNTAAAETVVEEKRTPASLFDPVPEETATA